MGKSSRSILRLLPVEDAESTRWAAGLLSCASLCLRSADKMQRGAMPGNWRKSVGMAKLFEKVADSLCPRRSRGAGKNVQEHSKQGEAVEAPCRKSDGKKSDVPRKAIVG